MHDDDSGLGTAERAYITVVDDDENILASIKGLLAMEGIQTRTFPGFDERAEKSAGGDCALVLLDMYIGSQNGHEILNSLMLRDPLLPVVMISGLASPEEAVRSIKAGAFDFIEKPFSPERLLLTVRNAYRYRELSASILARTVPVRSSSAMQAVCASAAKYANSRAPVLITGESGTGKDVIANLVQSLSPDADKAFIKINCGAIPKDLADSELFGHARGSFTGAEREYGGRIAAADGGTLFLDEIGELPPAVQVKLLRFLESGEIQRIGETKSRIVKARVIAATNVDLEKAVREGGFRKDLFFRLNVLSIFVPPLRERKDDIEALAKWFLAETAKSGRHSPVIGGDAIAALEEYDFPGNVRELKNVIERISCMSGETGIDRKTVREALGGAAPIGNGDAQNTGVADSILSRTMPFSEAKTMLETAYLAQQFMLHGRSVKATAEALGLLPNNLSRRMKQLGIS